MFDIVYHEVYKKSRFIITPNRRLLDIKRRKA